MRTYHLFPGILIFLFIIGLFACQKKSENPNTIVVVDTIPIVIPDTVPIPDTIPIVVPDSILYTDLIPDTTATSIREWGVGYNIPVPADSFATIKLDVNKDNVFDLKANVGTMYYWVSNINAFANYSYYASLSMLQSSDSIAFYYTNGFCKIASAFNKDSVISENLSYSNHADTYAKGNAWGPCFCNTFNGDTYYGFKISVIGGYNYGWILMSFNVGSNKITVKGYAINKTLNKPIKAGQKTG